MKRILIILCLIGFWSACTYQKPGFYEGPDGLCFYYDQVGPYDSNPYFGEGIDGRDSMTVVSSVKERDTLWFRIMIYGQQATEERFFSLKQSTLSYLDSTAYLNDSTFLAVEGVNFVAFDDPEMQQYYRVDPDSSSVYVPIIMTYDPNTAGTYQHFYLFFEIVPTEDFVVFDPRFYRAELQMLQDSI